MSDSYTAERALWKLNIRRANNVITVAAAQRTALTASETDFVLG